MEEHSFLTPSPFPVYHTTSRASVVDALCLARGHPSQQSYIITPTVFLTITPDPLPLL
jgi:hypothetical protein